MKALRKPVFRLLALLPVALLSAAACGGKSFSADGYGAGGSGNAGASGSGVAGNAVAGFGAGGAGTAGSSVGGSANAGASSGGAASGGTASGGSANGGGSGGTDISSCVENTDCVIEPVSCCSCGSGPVTDYTAINSKFADQYHPNCMGIACGPCPPTAFNPNDPRLYYVATCQASLTVGDNVVHQCRVLDIRKDPDLTACQSDADCALRSGTGCCQGCGTQAIAINPSNEGQLESLVCPTQAFGCAECAAPNDSGLGAACMSGQCSVALTPCTVEHPCAL